MPVDYTNTKSAPGSSYPPASVGEHWDAVEPLITPAQLRSLHLFGLPLYSAMLDPVTKRYTKMEDSDLETYISQAVGLAEIEGGFDIFPRQYQERHPYDYSAQQSFGYMVLRRRPVTSIESLSLMSTDGVKIWDVPLAWIEMGYASQGQIQLVPFAISSGSGGTVPVVSPASAGLLPNFMNSRWVGAMWTVQYTAGFKDGSLPRPVNQLIGVVAAMEVLSMIATTYARSQSASLNMDGVGQSVSTPGPQLFAQRMNELGEKRKWLVARLKNQFGLGFFSDNV